MKKDQCFEFRKIEAVINNICGRVVVNSVEKHFMKGSELIEWGITEDPQDPTKKINPDQRYIYNQPVQQDINHYRRLKEAFKKNGKGGVNHYLGTILSRVQKVAE